MRQTTKYTEVVLFGVYYVDKFDYDLSILYAQILSGYSCTHSSPNMIIPPIQ